GGIRTEAGYESSCSWASPSFVIRARPEDFKQRMPGIVLRMRWWQESPERARAAPVAVPGQHEPGSRVKLAFRESPSRVREALERHKQVRGCNQRDRLEPKSEHLFFGKLGEGIIRNDDFGSFFVERELEVETEDLKRGDIEVVSAV